MIRPWNRVWTMIPRCPSKFEVNAISPSGVMKDSLFQGCTLLCFKLRSSSTPFPFLFSRFPREITLATTQNFVRTCPLWPKTWGPSQFSKLRCTPSFWYISSFGKGYMWGHTFSDRRSPQPFNPLRELYWIWVLWEESTLVLYDLWKVL